jgi:hypothetical protein
MKETEECKYFAVSMGLTSIGIIIIAIFLSIHALWFALVNANMENEKLTKQIQELSHTCGEKR